MINPLSSPDDPKLLLRIENLQTEFITSWGRAKAVDRVEFELRDGQTLGIVGESGSGKSVTALSLLKLIPSPPGKITAGRVLFKGQDLLQMPEKKIASIRGNQISMIFQEPMTSLNPVFSVGFQIAEMFRLHRQMGKKAALERAVEMLKLVHIPSPEKRIHEYPHELSGGMRQRVMIAMALCCDPQLLIADEPTTALDVTIQAQIMELMADLRQKLSMALILITHDLGIVANAVEHIAVMYAGQIVEAGDTCSIFETPLHPYTQGLLKAVPRMEHATGSTPKRLFEIKGVVPSLYNLPPGCNFYSRCPQRQPQCGEIEPRLTTTDGDHRVSCWLPLGSDRKE